MRFIIPILLIVLSGGLFWLFTNPTWTEVKALRAEQAEYDQALFNAKQLEIIRNDLLSKTGKFAEKDVERLEKMVPDNVDNIRLIIEIENIAAPHNLTIRNVKYDGDVKAEGSTTADQDARKATEATKKGAKENKNYSTFNLEFSTQGTYEDFVAFITKLENSLRIVDITGLSFTAGETEAKNVYKFDVKIKTYYLKN
jgi:Tfp pilus assembly protein PilO